jgi:tRNA-specific 2-thiouridylase
VVDALTGAVVGSHDGAYGFTVGQRKGLALTVPAADGRPRYVLGIEPVSRTVTVGPREALQVGEVRAERPRWLADRALPLACTVQLQAHGAPRPCVVQPDGGADGQAWRIVLDVPADGVAAGQAAVLYDGDRVLASATVAGPQGDGG